MRSVPARRRSKCLTMKQSSERRAKKKNEKKEKKKEQSRDQERPVENKSTPTTKLNWRRDDLMIWWRGRRELEMTTQRLSRQRAQPHYYSIDSNGQ
ncbi:hypothetical protein EUGRSUZ_G00551 [Eucalyptus grandis]|uniref:Uncharacterized protein n=2 Tax=Eucalyptus grandis TaxID=71139 RepID=A0ACC3K0R6_EUCGR|nr:hypothetical protein EUGRSUZ_G00551 [Eucalyptus grandis]